MEAYSRHPVTIEKVERWVAADRSKLSPDDVGKNLDMRDGGETDTQIAWKVLTAINNERAGGAGLEAAIRKYLEAEQDTGDLPPEMYDQVLVAWLDVFTPVAQAAWAAWVHQWVGAL